MGAHSGEGGQRGTADELERRWMTDGATVGGCTEALKPMEVRRRWREGAGVEGEVACAAGRPRLLDERHLIVNYNNTRQSYGFSLRIHRG